MNCSFSQIEMKMQLFLLSDDCKYVSLQSKHPTMVDFIVYVFPFSY